jgi:antitoxin component of MazEF toxin-antitoxin module
LVSVERRRIMRDGGSRTVALPPHWLDAQRLEKGDTVEVVYNDLILVLPIDFSLEPDSIRRELECISRFRSANDKKIQAVSNQGEHEE